MPRYVLIAYDISDPKRLRRVHKLVRGYGDALQYSVFLGQLSEKDEAVLRERLKDIINAKEDQVMLIRLGDVGAKRSVSPENWTVLGRKVVLQDYTYMIY